MNEIVESGFVTEIKRVICPNCDAVTGSNYLEPDGSGCIFCTW